MGVERRDLLKGALAALTSGCASQPARAPQPVASAALDPREADRLIASLDRRLAWIGEQTLPEDLLPLTDVASSVEFERELEKLTSLTRKAMRSLYLTGRVLDLPDEMKAHPGVQARVAAMMPEMDEAVLGVTAMLEAMTPEDHRQIQRSLKADPRLGERLAQYLQAPALDDGIPYRRRLGVRAMVMQLSRRMAFQSPALVTDPLVRKVRRIQARPEYHSEQARLLAARVGQEAFWAHQEKMAALHDAWAEKLGGIEVAASPRIVYPHSAASSGDMSKGDKLVTAGGIVMGFGGASAATGLILWAIMDVEGIGAVNIAALVFGATIGPLALLTGLIIIIVGGAYMACE